MPLLLGCPSRKEVEAEVWLQSGIPAEICEREPELKKVGIYRKLSNGKFEVLSYCTLTVEAPIVPAVQGYVTIHGKKFKKFLDELLPEVQE
jgi:hypothetical protein